MENELNPLDEMGITRKHIIALREAYTQTNKVRSQDRAQALLDLFKILQKFDHKRSSLFWDQE